MTAFQECQAIVSDFFEGNAEKINAWWNTPNPALGGIPPALMVDTGRVEKLLKVIRGWREGNFP